MIDISPQAVIILMFGGLFIGALLGYPLALVIGGVAMFVGFVAIGESVFDIFQMRIFALLTNYTLLAAPLFILMGVMVERTGIAERLYDGLYIWFGGIRGGLAIATILMGVVLSACVGIIAASIIMLGLIASPSMIKRGYDTKLVSGTVCAAGCLGILIPPSVMLIFYGPMANLSVGELLMGAFLPGLLLSGLYILYIGVISLINPRIAPPVPREERDIPFLKKFKILITSMLPPIILISAILGSIFFGIAAPTEAAAVGALAATLMAAAYRKLTFKVLSEAAVYTLKIISMALFIGVCASMFTAVFLKLGGGTEISRLLTSVPGGKWGTLAAIMFIVFLLGMVIDWIGILFIVIPIVTPIGELLGFDPIWFALMICINLQTSFMSPPFAPAIFFYKSIVKPEWNISTADIIRGVIPFIILVVIGITLCIVFPSIITWLPEHMIK